MSVRPLLKVTVKCLFLVDCLYPSFTRTRGRDCSNCDGGYKYFVLALVVCTATEWLFPSLGFYWDKLEFHCWDTDVHINWRLKLTTHNTSYCRPSCACTPAEYVGDMYHHMCDQIISTGKGQTFDYSSLTNGTLGA